MVKVAKITAFTTAISSFSLTEFEITSIFVLLWKVQPVYSGFIAVLLNYIYCCLTQLLEKLCAIKWWNEYKLFELNRELEFGNMVTPSYRLYSLIPTFRFYS